MFINGDQIQVPAHLNFGKFIFYQLRIANPKDVCLENCDTGEQLTYAEFTDYAISLSVGLSELGVKKGDVVGVGSEKRITFLPTCLAIVLTGAAYTPFDLDIGTAVFNHKVSLTTPNYFICTALFWKLYGGIIQGCGFIKTVICFEEVEGVKLSIQKLLSARVDAETYEPATVEGQTDIAVILYSSGTTGMSKGVPVTHLSLIISCLPNEFQDECVKTALSFGEFHNRYEIVTTYAVLAAGRKVVYANNLAPDVILKIIQDYQVNSAFLVPSLITYLAKTEEKERYDLSSLKILYSCAAPLRSNIIETMKKRFPKLKHLIQIYGMTECGEITSESWCNKGHKPGSVGVAAPGITLKVVNPKTRAILGPNQRGEICVRGPVVMKGYLGTSATPHFDEQGFFLTGDVGYYDEDGYFYIVDRLKDMFCYDGDEVSPIELESILQQHPCVRAAGVAGRPAGARGHAPAAFVVRQPGADLSEQDIVDYASSQVSPFMQLRGGVFFVSELPRNGLGKVLRRQLSEMLGEM